LSESESERNLRAFIGVPVSMRSLRAIAAAGVELREREPAARKFRWVSPARYHVTLKFLGWIRPEVVPAIRDCVADAIAGQKSFAFRCQGLGAFPSPEKARVLWAGVKSGSEVLDELAQKIDAACGELGFPVEQRDYHPHVTMARLKPPRDVARLLEDAPVTMFSKSVIDRLVLYRSNVGPAEAEYERIVEWPLAGAE
jgi:2'-5' RNA ligase